MKGLKEIKELFPNKIIDSAAKTERSNDIP